MKTIYNFMANVWSNADIAEINWNEPNEPAVKTTRVQMSI